MNVEEICKKVRSLCEDAGSQFFFTVPNASEWAVTDCEHLRKIVSYHKELETLPPVAPTQRWIPVSERLPKEKEFPCLASDKWGQMWIPVSVVTINNRCFDGKDFEFDVEKFFKGKEVTIYDGVKVRELPREIVAWMPLPKPYKEGKEE